MPTLTVAPMALPESISMCAYKTIKSSGRVFLQTEKHPSSAWLKAEGIPYESMDGVYDRVYDFDELNEAIANELICGEDAVFAVCGRGISRELADCIESAAKANNTDVVVLPSSGYSEAAACTCGFNTANAYICTANSLPENINVYIPLCVEEIDTKISAGEVKLKLLDFYPDDAEIIFAYTDSAGSYKTRRIKLYELDRQDEFFATTVVLIRPYDFMELERYGTDGVEELVFRLRAPDGCPWDIKQTHESLKKSLIEECYEVMDAIDRQDEDALCEELGDLLLQVVFHACIETEKSCFKMRDVCTGLVKKLIFRHPHVFANAEGVNTPDDVLKAWDELKKQEKHQETQGETLKAVPKSFPALMRSSKVQKRAADVGFDFDNAFDALSKVAEEAHEVEEAARAEDKEAVFEETGDLLFAAVNVVRLLKVDPELALQAAADKFTDRFCKMEEMILKDGKNFKDMSLQSMDEYWNKCKTYLKI